MVEDYLSALHLISQSLPAHSAIVNCRLKALPAKKVDKIMNIKAILQCQLRCSLSPKPVWKYILIQSSDDPICLNPTHMEELPLGYTIYVF